MTKPDDFAWSKASFLANPSILTAGAYLSTALVSDCDDIIGDDDFRDAVSQVATFLSGMATRDVLRSYGTLHDRLSDMIESGRLREDDIPNDYRWLADTLTTLAPQIDTVLDLERRVAK